MLCKWNFNRNCKDKSREVERALSFVCVYDAAALPECICKEILLNWIQRFNLFCLNTVITLENRITLSTFLKYRLSGTILC